VCGEDIALVTIVRGHCFHVTFFCRPLNFCPTLLVSFLYFSSFSGGDDLSPSLPKRIGVRVCCEKDKNDTSKVGQKLYEVDKKKLRGNNDRVL
jgi:hypothetical protein